MDHPRNIIVLSFELTCSAWHIENPRRLHACKLKWCVWSRKPTPGDIIIFHPDRRIFGEAAEPDTNPVVKAVFDNAAFKAFRAFVGLDDDVFIKRIVAVAGDTVEVGIAFLLILFFQIS